MTQAKKTLKERFLHAFLFEILAIGLCAPSPHGPWANRCSKWVC